jgi:hypothetical protein
MRGLQRGAASFGSSTASAALELSNRLVQAIQVSVGCPGEGELSTHCVGQGGVRSSQFCPQNSAKGWGHGSSGRVPTQQT